MKKAVMVVIVALLPTAVFGQSALEKYQEARVAELRSDNAKSVAESSDAIGQAFSAISEVALTDSRYVGAFTQIARKYVARRSSSARFEISEKVIEVAKTSVYDPVFAGFVADFIDGYKSMLLKNGYAPNKPFVLIGKDQQYCSLPHDASYVFQLSQLVYPKDSAELKSWEKYADELRRTKLPHCGG